MKLMMDQGPVLQSFFIGEKGKKSKAHVLHTLHESGFFSNFLFTITENDYI